MKNIICIELTSYNQSGIDKLVTLNPILDDISLSYKSLNVGEKRLDLITMKKMGYDKVFIDSTNGLLISYSLKGKDKSIKINEHLIDGMDSTIVEKVDIPSKKLNSDYILDKISMKGMESLSEKELNYLKSL